MERMESTGSTKRKENRPVYRIDLHPVSLTDKEILFCVLSAMAVSLFTEGLGAVLVWLIPIAVGLTGAVAIGLLHARYEIAQNAVLAYMTNSSTGNKA